jgi:hypothetical protein
MAFLSTIIGHPLERSGPYRYSGLRTSAGQRIEARTLGEAVAIAERMFDVRIVPHDPPKWFRVYGIPGSSSEYVLVDIHVRRGSEAICAKQDLTFPLLDTDIVSIGLLAC